MAMAVIRRITLPVRRVMLRTPGSADGMFIYYAKHVDILQDFVGDPIEGSKVTQMMPWILYRERLDQSTQQRRLFCPE